MTLLGPIDFVRHATPIAATAGKVMTQPLLRHF
jgi:hypothetical protein